MLIKQATSKDFADWQALRQKLWSHVGESDSLEFLNQVLANNDEQQIFLAQTTTGKTIGFLEAALRRDYVEGCDTSPVGYIEGWFVEESYRRQNIGQKLVQAAEDWARELGCREMASDCELENLLSLKAHLGVGYEEVNRNIHFKKLL